MKENAQHGTVAPQNNQSDTEIFAKETKSPSRLML